MRNNTVELEKLREMGFTITKNADLEDLRERLGAVEFDEPVYERYKQILINKINRALSVD